MARQELRTASDSAAQGPEHVVRTTTQVDLAEAAHKRGGLSHTMRGLDSDERDSSLDAFGSMAEVLCREFGEESETALRLKWALIEQATESLGRAAALLEQDVLSRAAAVVELAARRERRAEQNAEIQAVLDELVRAEPAK